MVSSSTKDLGEALCESRYRSTNGCCMWPGNIPGKGGTCQLKTNICLLLVIKAGLPLMCVFARFQVVERKEADC